MVKTNPFSEIEKHFH